MGILSGKKALCFIALPHHNRFLVPMMEALTAQGMATHYFTAAAEGAFEITLNQAKLPYRHIYDYANEDTSARANAAFRTLRGQFQHTMLESPALQVVPVVIQDKTMRAAVDNFYCLDQMLRQERPDVLFALHELNPWGKMLGYLSHVHRIPVFHPARRVVLLPCFLSSVSYRLFDRVHGVGRSVQTDARPSRLRRGQNLSPRQHPDLGGERPLHQ